jgi:FixJ family two-component response regulator
MSSLTALRLRRKADPKVCIVDDDPSVLQSLKRLLAADDCEAETFDDSDKFLEQE